MRLKRLISAFIACAMLVTFMPMQAFAAPDDELYEVSQSQQDNSTVLNDWSESDVEDDISTQQVNYQWTWPVGHSEKIDCGWWTNWVGERDEYWYNSDYRVVQVTDYHPIIGTVRFNAISPGTTTITLYEDKEHTKVRYQWEITVEEDNNKSTDGSRESFEFSANSSNVDVAYAYYVDGDVASDLYPLKLGATICLPGTAKEYPIAFYVRATKGYVPESRFECAGSDGEYYPIDETSDLPQSKRAREDGYTKAFSFTGNKWFGYDHREFTIKAVPVEVSVQYASDTSDTVSDMPDEDVATYTHKRVDDKSEYQHEIVLPSQEPSRKGYTFKGWKLESDGITLNAEELYQHDDKITLDDNTWISATEEQATITFVAQWEEDEESAGSTDAYFYVLKPDFSGDPSTATPENFYYVGQGSIENPHAGEADGQQYTEPQEPVTDLPSDITAKLENIVWYYVSQADGANSNGDTPVVPDGTPTWHVDGYLTAPLTVNAVNSENEQEFSGLANWPKSESVRVGTEYTVVVGEDNNATIEVPQTITVDGQHYTYDEQDGVPLSGKMQLNGATVKIPYAPDNNEDGTPDKYQAFVKYVSADEEQGTVLGFDQVITFEDGREMGDVTTSQAFAQPNAGFEFDKWTVDYPTEGTFWSDYYLLEPNEFEDVPGGTTITFTAHFKSETQPYQLTFDANSGLINGQESFTLDLYADDLETDKLLYAPKLPDYVSMTVPENTVEDVVFAYWSQEDTNGRIFERGEDQLPDMCELVSFKGVQAVTIYAVWSADVNDNGKPDILEDTYTLTLNANGGKIEHRAAYEVPETYWSGDLVTPAEVGDLDMTAPDKAVLIGWSKEDTKEHIYTANDSLPLPQIVDVVRFEDQDITLYAVWGEDSDGDGNPDITEEKYTLQYDANGGTGAPNDRTGLLLNQQVTLDEGATMRHDDVNDKAVVFVGWSTNRENKIFGKNDAAPETVKEVTIEENEFLLNTVYAVWGYDENDNDEPDVTETRYAVTYTWDNAPAGSQLPSDQTLYLEGDTVDVDGSYTKDAVVKGTQNGVEGFYTFSGWKLENQVVTTFTMPNHKVTLVGAWTFTEDENGDKIPDERQIFVNYRSNDERYGTVSEKQQVFTFEDEDIKSGNLPEKQLSAEAIETSDGDFDRWTSDDFDDLFPVYRATLDVDVTFTVDQLGETYEVVANFDRETGGGGAQHPDAGDGDDDDNDRDDDTEEIIDEEVPLAETPWLNTEDHYAYIVGYSEDGTVRPNANITRAEVATIFFRLLTDNARDQFWMTSNNFSDVLPNDWYNTAVSTMVNMGIIQGYEDGTFRPNANITRAEFATIAARFLASGYEVEDDLFTDIANHWARESINDAAMAGWINGYEDGTFRPDAAITRAEAVTLVNNVLQRKPDADHMLDSMIKWPDNPEGTWYYEAIQEATNSHDYDLFEDAEYETWTALQENRDWAALEKDWANAHSA